MIFSKQMAKRIGILFLKIFVSVVSIFFVLKKIDIEQVGATMGNVNRTLLFVSFLFMNLAQFTSTMRLKILLTYIGIEIGFWQNLKLYYKGMFYNLFLPGGIGGDGLKAFILKNKYGQPLKMTASGLVLDRLSGLAGLAFLGCLGLIFSAHLVSENWLVWLSVSIIVVVYPAFYMLLRILFKTFEPSFLRLSVWGMAVNLVQSVSVIFLFLAIGINDNMIVYLTVFYFATAAMVFPFTVGGVGIRELVFILAPTYLPINPEAGLSFCLIFFVMNAISSLAGLFLRTDFSVQTAP